MFDFSSKFSDYNIQIHGVRVPVFELNKEDRIKRDIPETNSSLELLKFLIQKGFDKKIESGEIDISKKSEYQERLDYECSVVFPTDFVDYFLLAWDVVTLSKELGVPKGPARGSAASSLILYFLEVTDVDPLYHNLYFERFLSPSRTTPNIVDGIKYYNDCADVDLDFGSVERDILVTELKKRYPNRICKISTVGTLTGKECIGNVSKLVLNYKEEDKLQLTKLIPTLYGRVFSLDEARKNSKEFEEFCSQNEFAYKIARKLEGLIDSRGTHAAAYLISWNDLSESVPMEYAKDSRTGLEELVTSNDMSFVQLSNIKLDILGLKTASIVNKTCELAGISLKDVKFDYDNCFKYLHNKVESPYGLFQISGDCNLRVVNDVRPKNIDELSAVVALARPGALSFVDDYSKFTNEGISKEYHPIFEEVLGKTGGVCLYQEQLMAMLNKIGFSLEDGDKARKIIGKKLLDKVKEWDKKIKDKVEEKGLPYEVYESAWSILNASANYSFSLSHAVSYSYISCASIYLKHKYPAEFFLAAIEVEGEKSDFPEKFEQIQRELPSFGIQILGPDIVKSKIGFSIDGKNLRFGLKEIKGINVKTIDKLKSFIGSERKNKFQTFSAAKESSLPIGPLSALIQSGAILSEYSDRPRLVFEAQVFNCLTEKEKQYCLQNGSKYNYDLISALQDYLNWTDSNGKKFTKESRLQTIRKNSANYREIWQKNSKYPILASYYYEKRLLGFSYSSTLKDIFGYHNSNLCNSKDIQNLPNGSVFDFVGELKEVKRSVSKASGKPYVQLLLSDELGDVRSMLIGASYEKFSSKGEKEFPNEGEIVYLKARRGDSDLHWMIDFEVQERKIYTSLRELKKDSKEEIPSLTK